jgi:hypothetical protein
MVCPWLPSVDRRDLATHALDTAGKMQCTAYISLCGTFEANTPVRNRTFALTLVVFFQ